LGADSGALRYQDPASGDPAWAIRLSDQRVVAFDAICTHAGCPVDWDRPQHLLVCPCHGAVYDPAHGAQVLQGPAPSPLSPLRVRVDASGEVYALD
jgi:thiosulfate dehydrogenase [quinone] large subunit